MSKQGTRGKARFVSVFYSVVPSNEDEKSVVLITLRSHVLLSRYHLDDQQKFPHIQPGKISRRLRRALGLQSNQLPRHVYRMRSLGYPPGWVEDAKVSHSGLSLFNSEGQGELIQECEMLIQRQF